MGTISNDNLLKMLSPKFIKPLIQPSTPNSTSAESSPSASDRSTSSPTSPLHDSVVPKHNSYSVIPLFYHKLPKSTDAAGQRLREEARTLFLQKRSKELLDNNELKNLWALLEKNYTQPAINNEQLICYDDYLRVVRIAGEKFKLVEQ